MSEGRSQLQPSIRAGELTGQAGARKIYLYGKGIFSGAQVTQAAGWGLRLLSAADGPT